MEDTTRRALVRKLAAFAAAGYIAPKVTRIDAARAGSGPPTSPFGGDGERDHKRRRKHRRKRRHKRGDD